MTKKKTVEEDEIEAMIRPPFFPDADLWISIWFALMIISGDTNKSIYLSSISTIFFGGANWDFKITSHLMFRDWGLRGWYKVMSQRDINNVNPGWMVRFFICVYVFITKHWVNKRRKKIKNLNFRWKKYRNFLN